MKTEPWQKQTKALQEYQSKQHTEDCLEANDDTSVLKGKCICPKPKHTPTPKMGTSPGYVKLIAEQLGVTLETAAYIVRAVNAHEELVGLLKEIRKYTEAHEGYGLMIRKGDEFHRQIKHYDRTSSDES